MEGFDGFHDVGAVRDAPEDRDHFIFFELMSLLLSAGKTVHAVVAAADEGLGESLANVTSGSDNKYVDHFDLRQMCAFRTEREFLS